MKGHTKELGSEKEKKKLAKINVKKPHILYMIVNWTRQGWFPLAATLDSYGDQSFVDCSHRHMVKAWKMLLLN